uniref:Ovule protein n=1 Tax=Steinernema glaseri TaxID=37863 RepID=A0A1I7Z730_9BILA
MVRETSVTGSISWKSLTFLVFHEERTGKICESYGSTKEEFSKKSRAEQRVSSAFPPSTASSNMCVHTYALEIRSLIIAS